MNPQKPGRRQFLKGGAALAGLAVGAPAALAAADAPVLEKVDELHLYGERSHYVTSARNGSIKSPRAIFNRSKLALPAAGSR